MSESVDAAPTELADILVRADRYLAQYDPAPALAAYDEALTRDPTSPVARAGRVRALWILRRGEEAVQELTELAAEFPDVPQVAVAEGIVSLGMRDDPALLGIEGGACLSNLDQAAERFDHARRLAPESIEAIRGQATVLRLRGDYPAACRLLDESLAELGRPVPLLVELANCAIDQWRLTDAVDLLRQALEADGLRAEAHAALWFTLGERMGKHGEAFPLLERERAVGDLSGPVIDEVAGWLHRTCVAHTADPVERQVARQKARDAFTAALATQPLHASAIAGLAWLDRDEYGVSVAMTRVEAALADDPYSPQLNNLRGWLLLESQEPADAKVALSLFRVARDVAPYLTDSWSGFIAAATAIGDLATATEAWEQMERRFPRNTEMFVAGSRLAIQRRQPQTALDLAEKALRVAPDRRDLVAERASALLAIGYYAEASQPDDPLGAAARQWPGDVWLRWQLFQRAEAEGRLHETLSICQEIVKLTPIDQNAKDWETEIRRRLRIRPFYRMFGRRVDEEALRNAEFTAEDAEGLARYVPQDVRMGVGARLRALVWREARLNASEKAVLDDNLFLWLVLVCGALLGVLPWLGGYLGDAGWWNIGRSALAIGVYTAYWVVIVTTPRMIIASGCVVVAAVSAWSLVPSESGITLLLRAVVLAPAVILLLQVGLMVALYAVTDHHRGRVIAAEAHGVLVRDLLRLLRTVEDASSAVDPRAVVPLIESIAQAQARVVRQAGAGDKTLSQYAGHRALGVAAATRDLKHKLVTWDANAPKVLFRRASRMLDAVCRGEWGRFAYRKPDLLPRQLRLRVWLIARLVVMGGVVALGVWLVVVSRQNPNASSATLTTITGLITTVAPVVVPLVEWINNHSDRVDPRKGSPAPPDEPLPPPRRH